MQVGVAYTLRVTGCLIELPTLCGASETRIALRDQPMTGGIEGGDRTVGDHSTFRISACSTRDPDDPVAGRIDRSTDHAIFFLGLWVAKVSPKSPVPIPEEGLLYEASRTDVDALAFPSLRAPVLGLRSTTYGRNELCDLAQRDADALEAVHSLDDDSSGCE